MYLQKIKVAACALSLEHSFFSFWKTTIVCICSRVFDQYLKTYNIQKVRLTNPVIPLCCTFYESCEEFMLEFSVLGCFLYSRNLILLLICLLVFGLLWGFLFFFLVGRSVTEN